MALTLTDCPDPACGQVAEVVDRWQAESTDGPVTHLRTRCLNGHHFDQILEERP